MSAPLAGLAAIGAAMWFGRRRDGGLGSSDAEHDFEGRSDTRHFAEQWVIFMEAAERDDFCDIIAPLVQMGLYGGSAVTNGYYAGTEASINGANAVERAFRAAVDGIKRSIESALGAAPEIHEVGLKTRLRIIEKLMEAQLAENERTGRQHEGTTLLVNLAEVAFNVGQALAEDIATGRNEPSEKTISLVSAIGRATGVLEQICREQ
jgi:hypothetical protein